MTERKQGILVTGATGFLGRRLCERLKREGEHVVALGRQTVEGPWDSFIETDLSVDGLEAGHLADVSTIYHLASRAHAVAETAADADSYRPVIVEGTRRLLRVAREAGIRRFIYFSTVKVMGEGNPEGLPLAAMNEDWPHTPQSPYGLAKAEAEELVKAAGLEHAVILRPVMVYGPGEKGNLPRMLEAVRHRRFPPIPENGNKRSMIHVDDLVEYAIRAAARPIAAGRVYILTGPEPVSTRQLYDAIRESLGLPRQDWSIPGWLLAAAAVVGSGVGGILGKRLPLDRETLAKLTGSAWYSSRRAQVELDYRPRHGVLEWLLNGD
jgi:nucleoside-diphosphate-sugar epimerase